jgi:hypothetical protein
MRTRRELNSAKMLNTNNLMSNFKILFL